MKLITNRISTGKSIRFEDFVAKFKKQNQIKTASVKTAEHDEADSSGQLDVEPLHQKGESTTMPKSGPSAKKEGNEGKSAVNTKAVDTKKPDTEGDSSGQPEAEGKLTNDPETPSKEEKGGSTEDAIKVAEHCDKCDKDNCDCDCKSCTATKEEDIKTAGIKGNCSKCGKPNFLCKGKCSGDDLGDKKDDDSEDKKDDKKDEEKDDKKDEEKEASVKCDTCDNDPCECKKASAVKFVKISNLDDKNKSFLKEYWRQLFGDEYVSALISDK